MSWEPVRIYFTESDDPFILERGYSLEGIM